MLYNQIINQVVNKNLTITEDLSININTSVIEGMLIGGRSKNSRIVNSDLCSLLAS